VTSREMTRADIVEMHTITLAEVEGWFKCHREPWPNAAICVEIAARLSRMRWGDDPRYGPPQPAAEDDPPPSKWDHPHWSSEQVADAAKLLYASAPAMLKHWENRRASPESNAGYHAIMMFRDAIMLALPYIECPFGKRYPYKKPKNWLVPNWHMPAILIAYWISEARIKAGHPPPRKLSENTPTIKITHKALERMKYVVERTTLAAYLTRREKALKREAQKLDLELRGMGTSLDLITKRMEEAARG
jgi:hypothetical protein